MELYPHTVAFIETFFNYALGLLILLIILSAFMRGKASKRN